MTQLEKRDYFTDSELLVDPYSYYKVMRELSPVYKLPDRDIMLVTGYEECRQILSDNETFSSVSASPGAATPLPFEAHGDDIRDLMEENRSRIPLFDMVTSLDGAPHKKARALLNKLFVPRRLKANEEYMTDLAATMVEEIVARGHCDIIGDVATPFVTLVIADLLGVPSADREMFKKALATAPTLYDVNNPDRSTNDGPSGYRDMGGVFYGYIQDRRANPREDILTQIAQETYPDGTTPDAGELARIVMTIFGAGQDTSAKLLGNAVRYFCEDQDMQTTLRNDLDQVGPFLEEMLRLEGSTKVTSRVALRKTVVGGVEVPAGQIMAVVLGGANRDPRRWENPDAFILNRPKAIEHLAFGRGPHTCIGAPLARAEVRIFLKHFLARTSAITISETSHGPAGSRNLRYEPSYGMRGLIDLAIDIKPA